MKNNFSLTVISHDEELQKAVHSIIGRYPIEDMEDEYKFHINCITAEEMRAILIGYYNMVDDFTIYEWDENKHEYKERQY